MKYWAVIPAAGIGSRMQADTPKQYLRIHGKRVIDWTITALLRQPRIETVMVALSAEDSFWSASESAQDDRVSTVLGGAERCHSVLSALQELSAVAHPDDWVLVHDAARPCVRQNDISRLMDMTSTGIGGVLGVPVHDTMKRTDAGGQIIATVDRDRLWHAHTPQMFPLEKLRQAIQGALAAGVVITDEASAMEWAGCRPLMVEDSASNIKITRPVDLKLAAFYLQDQELV